MFQVVWDPNALDELAAAWLRADSTVRQAITDAVQAIDHQLESFPDQQGESRADNQRILFHAPLGIVFEVDVQSHLVWVIHTWSYRQGGRS